MFRGHDGLVRNANGELCTDPTVLDAIKRGELGQAHVAIEDAAREKRGQNVKIKSFTSTRSRHGVSVTPAPAS